MKMYHSQKTHGILVGPWNTGRTLDPWSRFHQTLINTVGVMQSAAFPIPHAIQKSHNGCMVRRSKNTPTGMTTTSVSTVQTDIFSAPCSEACCMWAIILVSTLSGCSCNLTNPIPIQSLTNCMFIYYIYNI